MQINSANREILGKIVYYGPGVGGKTTNLQQIHAALDPASRSRLISMPNHEDRTLFFDLLALEHGEINGFKIRFQLFTVPGQVYYNATRKLVLRGVDGLVFVADSDPDRLDANEESMQNLYDNLSAMGIDPHGLQDPARLPLVLQYNKRDKPGAVATDTLQDLLNPDGLPAFEAVAVQGTGVFETLKEVMALSAQAIEAKV